MYADTEDETFTQLHHVLAWHLVPQVRSTNLGVSISNLLTSPKLSNIPTSYKVPLREVARGVAQERNEKHPA